LLREFPAALPCEQGRLLTSRRRNLRILRGLDEERRSLKSVVTVHKVWWHENGMDSDLEMLLKVRFRDSS